MNNIQKILWSIFCSTICLLHKPSNANNAACWALITKVKTSTCGRDGTMDNIIKTECRNKSGIKAANSATVSAACFFLHIGRTSTDFNITNEMNNIYISQQHNIIGDKNTSTNICNNKYDYYFCEPSVNPSTSHYCCTQCPTMNGISVKDLLVNNNGYTATPLYNSTNVNSDVYVNICSNQSANGNTLDGLYFQVYKSIGNCHVGTKTQTTKDCYIKPKNPYTDQTGTYSYQDTACEYTE